MKQEKQTETYDRGTINYKQKMKTNIRSFYK